MEDVHNLLRDWRNWGRLNQQIPPEGTDWRSWLTIGAGGLLPLAGELVDYLQTLDWRHYVLAGDRKNLAVLAIVGGLGFVGVILRHLTTGPVGTKD